jgi:hypothetical protein
MTYTRGLFLFLCFILQVSQAQDSAIAASTGLGPGDSFTLFVTFQNPMPKIQSISCAFDLQGTRRGGQEDFPGQLRCSGQPTKDDDTHYRVKVEIPDEIAAGDYKVSWINVATSNLVGHQYNGANLPVLSPVTVIDRRHVDFSPIKKLEVK